MSRSIEIVVHCFKYAKALAWQIDSLDKQYWNAKSPCSVTLSVCCNHNCDEDTDNLLDHWSHRINIGDIFAMGQGLPELFNRAIGRNAAARLTKADWVWFCDADYSFGPNCLRELAALNPDDYTLVYPREVWISRTHELGDQYLQEGPARGIDPADFKRKRLGKAIGGVQIVPGRIARENGYCDWPKAQQPVEGDSMADTRGDRSFRVSLGTPGTPIDLSDVYRIRHSTSGLARKVGGRENWTGN